MSRLTMLDDEEIFGNNATDAYFKRTEETLQYSDKNPTVTAEIAMSPFPSREHKVLAGLNDVAQLLEGLPVDADALKEGQLFTGGPVIRIMGPYQSFASLETSILGLLSHASGIATNALEVRMADRNTSILSFGARHVHPAIAPIVERGSLIGGLDGFSHVAAGNKLGQSASGTMPHALLLVFGEGNQKDAYRAFNNAVPDDTPRIALCDTFEDETSEVQKAVEELGDDIDGVRLDTTSSRRGDFKHIIKEVKWELESHGYQQVPIYISGGLGPKDVNELGDLVDGFGIGGYVSNADPVDFSLDIVEKEGKPISKRGKLSGVKAVYRENGEHKIALQKNYSGNSLMEPLIRNGEIVREFDIENAAQKAQEEASELGFRENKSYMSY